jgi:hypothetical protein
MVECMGHYLTMKIVRIGNYSQKYIQKKSTLNNKRNAEDSIV